MINHKRGDTLEIQATYLDDNDAPVDLSNMDIKMQCRTKFDKLIFSAELNNGITVLDAINGTFLIKIDDTSNFLAGLHYADIQYTKDGKIQSTETFEFNVVKDVTR